MDEIQEVTKALELAQQGYWMPATIVGASLSIIIVLILAIYNRDMKSVKQRQEEHDAIVKSLTENQSTMSALLVELTAENKYKDREIRDIKEGLKENRNDIKEIMK